MKGNISVPNWGEFLDDHEEQHAVPTGAALGFVAVATGELQQLGIALTVLTEAVERGRDRPEASVRQDLAEDVRREPHYFAAGLVLGGLLGLGSRVATGAGLPLPL